MPERPPVAVSVGRVETAGEARRQMLAWANGELSHTNAILNVGAVHESAASHVVALAQIEVADAAEVQKWAFVYMALRDA